jgi:hypothetical protein
MLSFACVLESVGYDRLDREAFAELMELRRPSSGTRFILCDLDDCDNDDGSVALCVVVVGGRGAGFARAGALVSLAVPVLLAVAVLAFRAARVLFAAPSVRVRRVHGGSACVECVFGLGCVCGQTSPRAPTGCSNSVCGGLVARRTYQRRDPPSMGGDGRSDARGGCVRRAGCDVEKRRRQSAPVCRRGGHRRRACLRSGDVVAGCMDQHVRPNSGPLTSPHHRDPTHLDHLKLRLARCSTGHVISLVQSPQQAVARAAQSLSCLESDSW